jgi:hypothetical protein
MVVDNFHLYWLHVSSAKTETVLVINTNAMLSAAPLSKPQADCLGEFACVHSHVTLWLM